MKVKALAALVTAIVLSAAALASEHRRMHIEIAVDDDENGAQSFNFDSDEAGFDLGQMQVGESQTFTDSEGKAALVTRTESGFQFDVDGKTIEVPEISPARELELTDGTHEGDHVIKKVRKIEIIKGDGDIAIVEETHSPHDDVSIHSDEEHEVYVIKKEINVAN